MAAGSAVAMIGANLRYGSIANPNSTSFNKNFQCHPGGATEATLMFSLGALGMGANLVLMALILIKRQLRRWSQGLLFHQAMVDCARAAILLPLGVSIYKCQPVNKCSLVETAFLLLVTVSTVNMLTTVLNDSPVFPEGEGEGNLDHAAPLLMDSPQCVLFGTFMIWFASITINLGPTFLSGALAANSESRHNAPSCPLVHGPFRHYVLNVLWIFVNVVCVFLTLFHLHKLYRDLTKANVEALRVTGLITTLVSVTSSANRTNAEGNADAETARSATEEHKRMQRYLRRMEEEGVQRVKMFVVITAAYVLFWGPLFFVTLVHHPVIGSPIGYEVTLHVACVHAFINPTLFMVLHRGLRQAVLDICCGACTTWGDWLLGQRLTREESMPPQVATLLPPPPPQPNVYKSPSINKQRLSPMVRRYSTVNSYPDVSNQNPTPNIFTPIHDDGTTPCNHSFQTERKICVGTFLLSFHSDTSMPTISVTFQQLQVQLRGNENMIQIDEMTSNQWTPIAPEPTTARLVEPWEPSPRKKCEPWSLSFPESTGRTTARGLRDSAPRVKPPNKVHNVHTLTYSPELEFEQYSSAGSTE